jgi:hypothetical protein
MSIHSLLTMVALLLITLGTAAANERGLLFENSSAHDIKIVAPGISLVLSSGEKSEVLPTATEDTLGVKLNIWWRKDPLQLCQLFTPWSRHVLISGKRTIICRSKNL